MILYDNELLLDFPIKKIQRVLKLGKEKFIRAIDINKIMQIHDNDIELLLKRMQSEGYIERIEETLIYVNTIKGNLIASTNLIQTMSRDIANKKVAELLERVKKVNDENFFLYTVKMVKVYGEYIDKDKEYITRIDILTILEERAEENTNIYNDSIYTKDYENLLRYLKANTHGLMINSYQIFFQTKNIKGEIIYC